MGLNNGHFQGLGETSRLQRKIKKFQEVEKIIIWQKLDKMCRNDVQWRCTVWSRRYQITKLTYRQLYERIHWVIFSFQNFRTYRSGNRRFPTFHFRYKWNNTFHFRYKELVEVVCKLFFVFIFRELIYILTKKQFWGGNFLRLQFSINAFSMYNLRFSKNFQKNIWVTFSYSDFSTDVFDFCIYALLFSSFVSISKDRRQRMGIDV